MTDYIGCDVPSLEDDEPNGQMTDLDKRAAENVLVKDVNEKMLHEFGKKQYSGHLIVTPWSSRVLGRAMTLFEVERPSVTVVFRPCTHAQGEEKQGEEKQGEEQECFIFTRRTLF